VTDDEESITVVRELEETGVALLALKLANFDNFDCFACGRGKLDFELRSGMSGIASRAGIGALGGRGGGDGELLDSEVTRDGAGSYMESLFRAEPDGDTGISFGSLGVLL
jgi:hypothetical protein